MDTEVAYKRNKILYIINKGTVTTIDGKKANETNALQIHDEIMDKVYENGFTPTETIVLGYADFIRGIRHKLQLRLGANDQINSVITTSGAMKTVEGTTCYKVPKSLPIINKDGSEGTILYYLMELMQLRLNLVKNMILLFYVKKTIHH
jgi:hypothetical protein